MDLISFRIKNFRSIVDTNWVNLSADNVTTLVGQNESGKTAVLDALAITFSSKQATRDDLRYDSPLPEVSVRVKASKEEILAAIQSVEDASHREYLASLLEPKNTLMTWVFPTSQSENTPGQYSTTYAIQEPALAPLLAESLVQTSKQARATQPTGPAESDPEPTETASEAELAYEAAIEAATRSVDEFEAALFNLAPNFVLFQESSGLLPDKVDITDDFRLEPTVGATAANNFLTIAGVNLRTLVEGDTRSKAAILKAANQRFTENFREFWSQHIGKKSSLQLECAIHQYPQGTEKTGKPYLEFLITDTSAPLYPKQRSRGTRWFISFYLQLRASEVSRRNLVFLLDEPGANLHEKAQSDVLALIEKIRQTIGVIYTTHSPHLISEKYLHRILAVERDGDAPTNPTKVIGAHALGAASTDTLSPIFTTMGVAFSRQNAIRHHNNVILEELSSHYYLKAFWHLMKCTQEVHFLPATGTSNVPTFAQLFLGWGLEFVIVLDDEPSARKVFNSLKRDMFLDDHEWATRRMYKIPDCAGVEDIFHPDDYKRHVLGNDAVVLEGANSEWAKRNGAAKAIHALKFLQKVEANEIPMTGLHPESQSRVSALVERVDHMLKNYTN